MPGPRLLAAIGILAVALIMQTTLIALVVQGVRPDLVLAVVAGVGLVAGPWAGAVAGLLGGMMADLLTGRLLGLGMLSHMIAGSVSGLLAGRLFRENAFVPFVIGAVVTIVDQSLFILGARAFGIIIPFGDTVARIMVPSMWYNGLLTALSFPLVYRLNNKLAYSEPARH